MKLTLAKITLAAALLITSTPAAITHAAPKTAPSKTIPGATRLTNAKLGSDTSPKVSPDGTKIVFVRKQLGKSRIWIMNIDGSAQRELTTDSEPPEETDPSWLPDGSGVIYSAKHGSSFDIHLFNFADNYGYPILETDSNERHPSVSPLKFAKQMYESRETQNAYFRIAYISDEGGQKNLWTMSGNGTRRIQLTKNLNATPAHPAWSADGKLIAYDLTPKGGKTRLTFAAPPRRYIEEDELEQSRYAGDHEDAKIKTPPHIDSASRPAFSPNGLSLLYSSPEGIAITQLTAHTPDTLAPGSTSDPDWLPSGRGFVFTLKLDNALSVIMIKSVPGFDTDILNIAAEKPGKAETAALKDRGFYITPAQWRDFPAVYEQSVYRNQPVFITTDSLLHIYHIFFDYTLRRVETEKLLPQLKKLTTQMLTATLDDAAHAPPALRAAAESNAVLFAVAAKLLKLKTPALPPTIAKSASSELELITSASTMELSPAFASPIDYTQFIPRGHYTRSDALKSYFLAMMWYAKAPFFIGIGTPGREQEAESGLLRAALLTASLQRASAGAPYTTWQQIHTAASTLIGAAANPSPAVIAPILNDIHGNNPTPGAIVEKQKFDSLKQKIAELPQPQIAPVFGKTFSLMPQLLTPDARIIQQMIYDGTPPDVGTEQDPRRFSSGLDVMAVLGSKTARDILINSRHEDKYQNFTPALDSLTTEFSTLRPDFWTANIYNGWLSSITPLLTEKDSRHPAFMRGRPWSLKSLNTALGAWTELKHDTILYALQPYAAEGGDMAIEAAIPKEPIGYVEPEPQVFERLAYLAAKTRTTLDSLSLLPEDVARKFKKLESLAMFLKFVADKELAGLAPDEDDAPRIKRYGSELEALQLSIAEGVQVSLEDNRAALVADVQTALTPDGNFVLEEAIGDVDLIYVLVDMGGWRQICRGAVYSYYEFTQPAAERLTDQSWQEMLDASAAPDRPEWFTPLIVETKDPSY